MPSRKPARSVAKKAPGFSLSYMDRGADPRKDFYRFATGSWIRSHPLPPDKSRYTAGTELSEWNLLKLKEIAEGCARSSSDSGGQAGLVGRFYQSALDQGAREMEGYSPIEDLWQVAVEVSSSEDVAEALPLLHRDGPGGLFSAFSKPDDRESRVYAFFVWQGGLSLPDRDYYLTEEFAEIRKRYLSHLGRMFGMKGLEKREAEGWAQSVLKLETSIARASRSKTELRDPVKNYNRVRVGDLDGRYGTLSLKGYLQAAGVKNAEHIVLGQPEFLKAVDNLLSKEDPEAWRAYLCWNVLGAFAPFLHKEADDEDFDFFHRTLLGQKEPEPGWKRALRVVDAMIGEALGELYVAEHFPEEARRNAAELVDNLGEVLQDRIRSLDWMTAATKRVALEKFRRFRVKIGHPAKFRDYSSILVDADDYAGNVRRAQRFEFDREAARVGGEVDRDEWFMTPPTVNAYYSPETNEIVFPAGILQPPFFDFRADDAVNYGGIGVVIGHEITHGYDDQGRQYDPEGNLRDWWTKEDESAFKGRAERVVKAYSKQEVLPGLKLNGMLTLGENIADLGGVSIAYEALRRQLEKKRGSKRKIGGFTQQQRFFISWAQAWREVVSEQQVRRLAAIDPHSPGRFRATIPAMDHPAFDEAFPPSRATEKERIGVW